MLTFFPIEALITCVRRGLKTKQRDQRARCEGTGLQRKDR